MTLTLGQVADWIHAEGDFTTSCEATWYSIDSGTLGAGDLFFAVRGERVDGHDFVATALANGAVAAVVSNHWLAPDELDQCKLLRVPEGEDCVLSAMQTRARRVRESGGGRVVGVSGSAGKTTTKEMVAAVLEAKYRVLKSAGNLNNHFGVPLQLLRLEPEHEVAVIEMGMNHAGEIATLAGIARPNWAVVSNVAAVGELRATEKRGSVMAWRGAALVNDCYNSNPAALDAMVDALIAMPASRHVVVAGEMLELGPAGAAMHRACGERMAARGVDLVVGVRGLAEEVVAGAQAGGVAALFVASPAEAGAWMREHVRGGDAVLWKASGGVRLEGALEGLGD